MPNAINQLSDETFEPFLVHANASDVIDLGDLSFIDPYAMVGVLEAGRMFTGQGTRKTEAACIGQCPQIPRQDELLQVCGKIL